MDVSTDPHMRNYKNSGDVGLNNVRSKISFFKQKASSIEKLFPKNPIIRNLVIVLVAIVSAYFVYWIFFTYSSESTDDAYIDGRAVSIAPELSGIVSGLYVDDNQYVKKGQALIKISQRQYEDARDQAKGELEKSQSELMARKYLADIARKNFPAILQQARAQLDIANANEVKAEADYQRQRSLSKKATTQQEIDAATAALKQAQAQTRLAQAQVLQAEPVPQRIGEADSEIKQSSGQVETARAKLDRANLDLQRTMLVAPQDGWITKKSVDVGNYIVPGQQIFSIVSPEKWVTANFKENQLAHMRIGQPVEIYVDAYPKMNLKGHVDSIQQGTGSRFTAFPPENATGNFVKIVQRVPVKILIDSGIVPSIPLPLGISVIPKVILK
jgi:membrane fusion protein, multidrug efflux system